MPRFKLRRLKMLLSHKSNCRLKLKRRRYSWNLWTGVLWVEETARKHGQVGRGKREGRREAAPSPLSPGAWENSQHFAMPPLISLWNVAWETSAEIPYWWRVTTQIRYCFWLVVPLVKLASTNQKQYPDLGSNAWSVWNFCAHFSDLS